ncbi:MAG TPA: META domain-containing protein [Parafilimonas sp.]|nr:META domain-containing protein [Parafilimonas sp.]
MKHLLFAGLFLSAVLYGSNMQNNSLRYPGDSKVIQDTSTIAGGWYLMPVLPSDTAAGKIPTLNFDLSGGRFSGNNGCNTMSGSFFIKEDALRFGDNVVSTKMVCPGYNEKPFVDNLLKTNRFMIRDGVLQLMYNTTILSKWTRVADTSASKKA